MFAPHRFRAIVGERTTGLWLKLVHEDLTGALFPVGVVPHSPAQRRAALIRMEGTMTKTKLALIVTPIAIAVGLWGVKILLAPPISEAAITSSIPVGEIAQN